MNRIATISSKGQITVPAHIRRQLNIRPGDRLHIVKKGNTISITPDTYQEELDDLRRKVHDHLQRHNLTGLSWEEIRKRADRARLKDYQEKYGRSA